MTGDGADESLSKGSTRASRPASTWARMMPQWVAVSLDEASSKGSVSKEWACASEGMAMKAPSAAECSKKVLREIVMFFTLLMTSDCLPRTCVLCEAFRPQVSQCDEFGR